MFRKLAINSLMFMSLLGLSACNSNSNDAAVSIKLSCNPSKVEVGQTATCTGKIVDFNGTPVNSQAELTFSSTTPEVASIDSKTGIVTTHGPGIALIRATSPNLISRPLDFTVSWAKAQMQITDAISKADLVGATFEICETVTICSKVSSIESPGGTYTLTLSPKAYHSIRISKQGYITANFLNPVLYPEKLIVLPQIELLPDLQAQSIKIRGRAVNALTGLPMGGAFISLYSGLNNTTGTAVATATTTESGEYTINLPFGYYTVLGEYSEFNPTVSIATIYSFIDQDLGDIVLNPLNSNTGQWRFILDWGDTPADLDSHITGPTATQERFNVYFAKKIYSDAVTDVNLDVDDITSYGPETITLTKVTNGVVRYSVHDYTNRGKSTSEALRKSKARVRVYNGSNLISTFNVPSGKGDLWKVFTLDFTNLNSPVLIPENKFSTISDPSNAP